MLFSKEELDGFLKTSNEAHKNSPNLETLVKKDFYEWLNDLTAELKETISNNSLLDPKLKDERIKKGEFDFLYFIKTYFPHYFTIGGKCELHTYLANLFNEKIHSSNGSKNAIAAPRGHAKTTYSSILLPLWCIAYKKKNFIVELSDSVELVEATLESIKAELEENPNLRADFPDMCGFGKIWRIGEFITKNGVKLKAFGTGKKIRGVRFGIYRPDLVIADDLENDTNVRSRIQRDRLEEWLDEAVTNLGSLDEKLTIIYIGTILHTDSVLNRKIKNPFWNTKQFSSIIEYPKRMDLWSEWENIYRSEGEIKALKFYDKNKKLMDEGSKVLWSEALDIYKLMRKRAENKRSFDKEQQNSPNSDDAIFKKENFHFYKNAPHCDNYYMYADPAGGKNKSDFTAICVIGISVKERKIYVVQSVVKRLDGKETIKEILKLQRIYKCKKIGVETNGGQFFLKDWLFESAFDNGIKLPLKGVNNSQNKGVRIESLEIPLSSGEILLHKNQCALINQLLDYPEGEHDDAPDSLAGAYDLSKGGKEIRHKRRDITSIFKRKRYV